MRKNSKNTWKDTKLGEVLKLQGGFAFKSKDFIDEVIGEECSPIVRIQNIKKETIDFNDCVYFRVKDKNLFYNYRLDKGDIVIAMSGATTGKVGRMKQRMGALINQRVGKFVVLDEKKLDEEFLYQYLVSPSFKDKILLNAFGGAQPNISSKQIESLNILLPPLSEQKEIAKILLIVDKDIEKTDQIIKKTEKLKKGLMQKLLTRGIGHNKFKKTKLGEIPEEWGMGMIKEFCEVKGGKRLPKGKSLLENKTKYPYIRVSDFKDMSIDMTDMKYLSKDIYEKIERYIISKNDIYISIVGTIGLVGLVPKKLDKANLTENAAKIIINKSKIIKEFLAYYLSSAVGQKQINNLTIQTTQPKLALSRIEKINVFLPDIDEQKKIAKILSDIDSKIKINKQIKNKLTKLKKGLVQDLLSGRVRVK